MIKTQFAALPYGGLRHGAFKGDAPGNERFKRGIRPAGVDEDVQIDVKRASGIGIKSECERPADSVMQLGSGEDSRDFHRYFGRRQQPVRSSHFRCRRRHISG